MSKPVNPQLLPSHQPTTTSSTPHRGGRGRSRKVSNSELDPWGLEKILFTNHDDTDLAELAAVTTQSDAVSVINSNTPDLLTTAAANPTSTMSNTRVVTNHDTVAHTVSVKTRTPNTQHYAKYQNSRDETDVHVNTSPHTSSNSVFATTIEPQPMRTVTNQVTLATRHDSSQAVVDTHHANEPSLLDDVDSLVLSAQEATSESFAPIKQLTAHIDLEQIHQQQLESSQDLEATFAKLSSQSTRQEEVIQGFSNYKNPEYIYTDESIAQASPMMKQYLKIKGQHRDKVLFFRMGDFYEFFFEDAVIVAKELSLAVSSRQQHMGVTVPMAGVPHHAFEAYAAKMVNKGYAIAICEQTSDPKAKGLTERGVVRIFTPGTLSEDSYLPARDSKPLVAIFSDYLHYAVAVLDVSSGYLEVSSLNSYTECLNRIHQYNPAEIIYHDAQLINETLRSKYHLTYLDEDYFAPRVASDNIKAIYGKEMLARFADHKYLIPATGALIKYVQATQMVMPSHLQPIRFAHENNLVILDNATLANLELFVSNSGNKASAFVEVLDLCNSTMGARLFRRWVRQPIRNALQLNQRLDQVETLLNHQQARQQLATLLKSIGDIERIVARISLGNASPKDLGELRNNLLVVPHINKIITQQQLQVAPLAELVPIRDLLFAALEDKQPMFLRDGNVIRASFNPELAELRDIRDNIMVKLADIEERERTHTGIDNLTVKLSNSNDIYINIPNSANVTLEDLPPEYIFKQQLKAAKRYYTTELRALETTYAHSEQQIADLEREIFTSIIEALKQELKYIQNLANQLARLDVFVSLAQLAFENKYVRPKYNAEHQLIIKDGRHPVIEKLQREPFIPNDSTLTPEQSLAIITGPNMGGKSTYMRQNALIALMALIGSFVPASYANIPLFDKILTRIGASDDISTGKSTFMVEMSEMAYILDNATPDSLLLIDEIGRGTSTFDGLSLAWACAQYLAQHVSALTFFSTHYFELTSLAGQLANVINLSVSAIEHDDTISFLHEIKTGTANKSYGLAVAKLAGVPAPIIAIAQSQLAQLTQAQEATSAGITSDNGMPSSVPKAQLGVVEVAPVAVADALSLEQKQVLQLLTSVNPNELTPLRGLELLMQLQEMLKAK